MTAKALLHEKLRGFYAVLDRSSETLATQLVSPQGAGAQVLQVRLKPQDQPVSTRELLAISRMAREVTRRASALLIINDRLDVALAVEADGVHLGQTDLPVATARAIIASVGKTSLLVGLSTHTLEQLAAAQTSGADYLGFGPVFPTATKVAADEVVGVELLRIAAQRSQLPVIAIGGITSKNVGSVAKTGALGACSIGAVNQSADPAGSGRQLAAVFRGGISENHSNHQ